MGVSQKQHPNDPELSGPPNLPFRTQLFRQTPAWRPLRPGFLKVMTSSFPPPCSAGKSMLYLGHILQSLVIAVMNCMSFGNMPT